MPKASCGAVSSARRAAMSHCVRGNSARSGEPGSMPYVGPRQGDLARGAVRVAWRGSIRLATRVPEPWRAVSQPSATRSA